MSCTFLPTKLLLCMAAAAAVTASEVSWKPPAYKPVADAALLAAPHVQARSYALIDWPFLDGQWEGIIVDNDGAVWFSVSTHTGTHHAQLFRYHPSEGRVRHIACLGQVVGEKLSPDLPQDKIHTRMWQDGGVIYAATCDGHDVAGRVYRGGHWISIDRATGVVTALAKSVTDDGILTASWDPTRRLLYGHTNHQGLLVSFDPATRIETVLGMPWEGVATKWPRAIDLMIAPDGRVFGARHPDCTFWEYDPETRAIRTLTERSPTPQAVAHGDPKAIADFAASAIHLSVWDAGESCFYTIRSYDEMLLRFTPGNRGDAVRIDAVAPLGLPAGVHRFGNRYPACVLVQVGRTLWYTPYTGWGGEAHLVSYDLDQGVRRDHGPIITDGGRRIGEIHSMEASADGVLYAVGFTYSLEQERLDPVRENAMRDKYPFHPRLLIVDPSTDLVAQP